MFGRSLYDYGYHDDETYDAYDTGLYSWHGDVLSHLTLSTGATFLCVLGRETWLCMRLLPEARVLQEEGTRGCYQEACLVFARESGGLQIVSHLCLTTEYSQSTSSDLLILEFAISSMT